MAYLPAYVASAYEAYGTSPGPACRAYIPIRCTSPGGRMRVLAKPACIAAQSCTQPWVKMRLSGTPPVGG